MYKLIKKGFKMSPAERPSQDVLKKDGNAEESGPMNTNAYIVVRYYKGNNRVEGYPLCNPYLMQY